MYTRTHHRARFAAGALVALSLAAVAVAKGKSDLAIDNPPAANTENPLVQPNVIAGNFAMVRVAQGSDPLENPSGVITRCGLLSDGTHTEPDENTYLILDKNPGGPTAGYDYGRHFLYQGHENAGDLAYLTRINLDVTDPAHRITLLSPVNPATGKTAFNSIDGSTWNPFTRTMLFTQETGSPLGGVLEVAAQWTSTVPPPVRRLDCVLGSAAYEGIHPDDKGNLLLQEDAGGTSVSVNPNDETATNPVVAKVARQPNSFIYRFEPNNPGDLGQGGRLFALQVYTGSPLQALVFGGPTHDTSAHQAFLDVYSTAQKDLRTPGMSWLAVWVQVHDTGPIVNLNACTSFNANAAAKAAGATPFKRPENGQFVPGSDFNSFVFDETGDTDARAGNVQALADRGAWGSIFRVDFPFGNPVGTIQIIVTGDADHASFDNLTFADERTVLATEDRGDLLHDQLNKLDSVWAFDITDGSARRLVALGRDSIAAPNGEEDNEPTGLHVSDGASSIAGLLGTQAVETKEVHEKQIKPGPAVPPGLDRSRWFVTDQHGLNQLFEIFQLK